MQKPGDRVAQRPAIVVLVALLLVVGIATLAAGTARAAQYKVVNCAGNAGPPPYTYATNTASTQHPNGIFDFNNWCGGVGADPPGDSAMLRIAEHEPNGNAGQGAYGQVIFDSPAGTHFEAAGGYTRQAYDFNPGWLARFRALAWTAGGWYSWTTLNQGAGLPNSGVDRASSNVFAPHIWPFNYYIGFQKFVFELVCDLPGGCDRTKFNSTDANGFVFIMNDDWPSQVGFTNTGSDLLQGRWVRGTQIVYWDTTELGSGLRFERLRVDGLDPRMVVDYQALGLCDTQWSQGNGESARAFAPCMSGGPHHRNYALDTATLADGAHTVQVCTQDFGQYQGLNGTGGQSCDQRAIRVDNHQPGAPIALAVKSPNPNRYLDHLGAQFTLPPDPGSPIAKVHYDIVNAAGEAMVPEKALAATNPTEIPEVVGPQKSGDYRLRVWLEDSVGLQGPAAIALIPHDTTPPAAPQEISVTAPQTTRAAQAFDLSWRDITDAGSPIDAAHYEVLNGTGGVVVPKTTVNALTPQSIADLKTPRESGTFTLRLWLSDAEGNVGAPASVPLAYRCPRSEIDGGAKLSAALSPDGARDVVVAQGTGAGLTGRLLDGAGNGLGGASLCVFSRVITDTAPEFLGVAMTAPDGAYRFAIGAGPSREVTADYRPGQRELTATAQIATRVKPEFGVRRKVVHNKSFVRFEGWIPGPHNDNVLVVAQVRRGKGWLAFHRYRTREDGHFTILYRLNRTSRPTYYDVRAQVRYQPAFPYLQGTSDPLRFTVLPAGAGRR